MKFSDSPCLLREGKQEAVLSSSATAGSGIVKPDYDNLTLHVFELQDGCRAEKTVLNTVGEAELTVSIFRDGNVIKVELEQSSGRPWSLLFRDVRSLKFIKNAKFELAEQGLKLMPVGNVGRIIVEIE